MSKNIDLSFTKDPEWMAKREKLWKPIGKSLREDFKKSKVEEIKYYFMTGDFLNGQYLTGNACVLWFPLATNEGWDYVFENNVFKPEVFEYNFYHSLNNQDGVFLTDEEELAFWDYFHPREYQPEITSRVPIGREKEFVTIKVNPHKIASCMAINCFSFLTESWWKKNPKFYKRIEYFYSTLPHLEWEKEDYFKMAPESMSIRKFTVLAEYLFDLNIVKNKYPEDEAGGLSRMEFRDMLIARIEGMDNLPQKLKDVWHEVKSRY